jgi:hypothetical protein
MAPEDSIAIGRLGIYSWSWNGVCGVGRARGSVGASSRAAARHEISQQMPNISRAMTPQEID